MSLFYFNMYNIYIVNAQKDYYMERARCEANCEASAKHLQFYIMSVSVQVSGDSYAIFI